MDYLNTCPVSVDGKRKYISERKFEPNRITLGHSFFRNRCQVLLLCVIRTYTILHIRAYRGHAISAYLVSEIEENTFL